MISVEWYIWGEGTAYQCVAVGDPDVNSTGRNLDQAKSLIVDAYNRVHVASLTLDDFTFTPRPE